MTNFLQLVPVVALALLFFLWQNASKKLDDAHAKIAIIESTLKAQKEENEKVIQATSSRDKSNAQEDRRMAAVESQLKALAKKDSQVSDVLSIVIPPNALAGLLSRDGIPAANSTHTSTAAASNTATK